MKFRYSRDAHYGQIAKKKNLFAVRNIFGQQQNINLKELILVGYTFSCV